MKSVFEGLHLLVVCLLVGVSMAAVDVVGRARCGTVCVLGVDHCWGFAAGVFEGRKRWGGVMMYTIIDYFSDLFLTRRTIQDNSQRRLNLRLVCVRACCSCWAIPSRSK
jgi:hypothetical protein